MSAHTPGDFPMKYHGPLLLDPTRTISRDSTTVLGRIQKAEDYQAQRSHVFPGIESLRWYIRNHRTSLQEASALLYIAGRLWIDAAVFDDFVLAEGARASRKFAGAEGVET